MYNYYYYYYYYNYFNDQAIKPPKGKKIAFKNHQGKRYMSRIKRHFIIDKHHYVIEYIGKRVYECPESQDDFNHPVNILKSLENFQKR